MVSYAKQFEIQGRMYVVVRALNYRLKLRLNLKHRPVDRFLHAKQSGIRELEERDRVPLWTKTGVESEVAHDFMNAKQPERAWREGV